MRRNFLRFEIEKNNVELKRKLKNFYNLMASFYNNEREVSNKKLLFIRKNLDTLKEASRYISEINLKGNMPENMDTDEITKLCKDTYKNLKKLEGVFETWTSKEATNNTSPRDSSLKRNLDKIRLAQNNFKRFDTSMNMTNQEWDQIEKRFEER